MTVYPWRDNLFPDDSRVLVRCPRLTEHPDASREQWPWLEGVVLGQVNRNEWTIAITNDEATSVDLRSLPGGRLLVDEHDRRVIYRDSSEIAWRPPTQASS